MCGKCKTNVASVRNEAGDWFCASCWYPAPAPALTSGQEWPAASRMLLVGADDATGAAQGVLEQIAALVLAVDGLSEKVGAMNATVLETTARVDEALARFAGGPMGILRTRAKRAA
jgi:hypothetical protein